MRRFVFAMLLLGLASPVLAQEQNALNISDIKVFRNVSGSSQTHGTAYVLQEANTDSNVVIGATKGNASTLGMDVTTTTTADSDDFVGCQLDDDCGDDRLCRVIIFGPAICRWNGGDNTDTRLAEVGTSTVAGRLGSGTLAGQLLSLTVSQQVGQDTELANDNHANQTRWIWVRPSN